MWLLICITLTAWGLTDARLVSTAEVKNLTDEYFDFRIRENPKYASDYGIPKYQDTVEEWNYEAFRRRISMSREFKEKAEALLDGNDFVDRADRVGLAIMDYTLRKFLEGSEFMNYTATINGDLTNIATQIQLNPIDTEEKLAMWYKRVIAYKKVFEDQAELLNYGIASGLTQAQVNVEPYIAGYKEMIGDNLQAFFALKPWIDLGNSSSNRTFYEEGERVCTEMRNAMFTFVTKLENEYLPVCRDANHTSASSMPGGAEYYTNALKYFTSDDMTPEKAHQLGLEQVANITDSMRKIIADEGFVGTIREFVETLYQDSNETFPSQAAVKDGYRDMLTNRIRPNLHKEFEPEPEGIDLDLLDDPYGGIGRYTSPREQSDGSWTNGIFVYDGREYKTLLKIVMLPTLVHESVPGHHYQGTFVLLRTNLSDFRRFIAWSHYAQGGFNFPYYSAYAEGWGLYSEYLSGTSLGILETPREELGKLSLESLRAARLVVDTGLHYYNWTMQRAVDYLLENTILSNSACWTQVIRYVRWPGQSCSYKIGELKIRGVREKAIKMLGDHFDPKSFHDAILGLGPCPLNVMENEMEIWINDQMAIKPTTTLVTNIKPTTTPVTSSASSLRDWRALTTSLMLISSALTLIY